MGQCSQITLTGALCLCMGSWTGPCWLCFAKPDPGAGGDTSTQPPTCHCLRLEHLLVMCSLTVVVTVWVKQAAAQLSFGQPLF